MFSTRWQSSRSEYGIIIERDVAIPLGDGATLLADVFRPQAGGKFPALLAISPYSRATQSMEMLPVAFSGDRGSLETGDFNFYVRRGYAFVIANLRGTHGSGGFFGNLDPDPPAIQDISEVIEWLAGERWCDGNVGMLGVSYFSIVQKRVAALKPPHLKALFAPYGWTDAYRDAYYRGGILAHGFTTYWLRTYGPGFRIRNGLKDSWGEAKYRQAIAEALGDEEVTGVPHLASALRDPDAGVNPLINEIVLNPLYGQYYRERTVDFSRTDVPGYFGGDWGTYGLHLAGDLRAFGNWKGPKKLSIGPPVYLDRPLYQYAYESLRWFDYWLKGNDTGIMDESPVQLFIAGTNEWKSAEEWPLPEAKWTPFYLHADGLLSEHELWPNEGSTTFEDSPFHHGGATFRTPPMVENTEVCGPIVLNLFGSTTDAEALWFVSLWHVDSAGVETLLTRGWLRGSQRGLDPERSRPWQPVHLHTLREPLVPNEIHEFNIEIRPYGILLRTGERIGLRIKCADDEAPATFLERIAQGHVWRPGAAHVTVHHARAYPSHLLLPITRGNRIGTFISGGKLARLQSL